MASGDGALAVLVTHKESVIELHNSRAVMAHLMAFELDMLLLAHQSEGGSVLLLHLTRDLHQVGPLMVDARRDQHPRLRGNGQADRAKDDPQGKGHEIELAKKAPLDCSKALHRKQKFRKGCSLKIRKS